MSKRTKKDKRPVAKIDFKPYGAAIKAGRTKQKESRNKAADALFISPRYLANIENKGQHPSVQVFLELMSRYARWRLTGISSIQIPQISRRSPKSFPPSAGTSIRSPSGSTPEVLRIRPTWTRYGKGWTRYGSYKDTSYQVNAESSH